MTAIYWLIGIVVLLVIEALTMGLTTIWFAGGALAAFIACVAGADLLVQILLFVVISLVLLIFTRPLAKRYINKGEVKTNVQALIGKEARVTKQINNHAGTGEAVVAGQVWTARAADDGVILEPETLVTIVEVRGVKLIVKKMEE